MTDSMNSMWLPAKQKIIWMGLLAAILITSALLRFPAVTSSLPYPDHPDETHFMLAGSFINQNGSAAILNMEGYPPGVITLHFLAIKYLIPAEAHPAEALRWVRMLTVITSLGTLGLMAAIGIVADSPYAGLLAAGIWGWLPGSALEHSVFATANGYLVFFVLLATLLTLLAIKHESGRWTLYALTASLISVLFKYQALVILPIVFIAPHLKTVISNHFHIDPQTRTTLIDQAIVVGLFMLWLLLVFPFFAVRNVPILSEVTHPGQFSLVTIMESVDGLVADFGWAYFAQLTIGLVAITFFTTRSITQNAVVPMLAAIGVAWFFAVNFFGYQPARQFLPGMAALTLLSAFGIVELIRQMDKRTTNRYMKAGLLAVFIAALGFLQVTDGRISAHWTSERAKPDRRNDLREWFDQSLPPDLVVTDYTTQSIFHRGWGAYTGLNDIPYLITRDLTDETVSHWLDQDARYGILPYWRYAMIESDDPGYLDDLTIIKVIPSDPAFRDPGYAVVLFEPVNQQPMSTLGPIDIIDLDRDIQADVLRLRFYFRADSVPDGDYHVFLHLTSPEDPGSILSQADGIPLFDARRPTSTWADPGEILISRWFEIPLSEDLPATYVIRMGFYDPATGVRLLSVDGHDALVLDDLNQP